MKTLLRVIALVIALGIAAFWGFKGHHVGWTKTSVFEKHVDPVTELEGYTQVPRFVPGVDFLAAGLLVAAGLAGVSFLCPKRKV